MVLPSHYKLGSTGWRGFPAFGGGSIFCALLVLAIAGSGSFAQVTPVAPVTNGATAGGVYIDADGMVKARQTTDSKEMQQARMHARNLIGQKDAGKDQKLSYISLPKLFARIKELTEAGKEIPSDLKYPGGITQLKYVLVYPDERDLVIAGPGEAVDETNRWEPVGKTTGRPVLQVDDLIAALRMAGGDEQSEAFGCSIDPAPDALIKSGQVMREYARASRAERMAAMGKALGPQAVRVFGMAADTRIAFVCVAADYKLKRLDLGVEPSLVEGVGNSIDNSREAASRVWFEASYDPLLVSADGNCYEFSGPRLGLKAGKLMLDQRGATEKAMLFAKQFTSHMQQLAAMAPLFADLQNVTDLAMLAMLIRVDHLDQRSEWDYGWALKPEGYHLAKVTVPKTTETLVAYTNGSICAGGVNLVLGPLVAPTSRAVDTKKTLDVPREAGRKPGPLNK